jgi:hypothetical protein
MLVTVPRLSVLRTAAAAIALFSSATRPALGDAQPADQCAAAYELAQERRLEGALTEARVELRQCVRDECAEFIRSSCAEWLDQTEAAIPSLVLRVRRGGSDVTNVRVLKNGSAWLERIDARAIEVNPGSYKLSFETQDGARAVVDVTVRETEKNRAVDVDIPVGAAALKAAAAPPARSDTPAAASRNLTAPLVALGVGTAALGGFVALASVGRKQESDLADECGPRCSDDELAPVRTKYLFADVALGTSIVAFGVAAYLLFIPGPQQPRASNITVHVGGTPRAPFASLAGAF